MQYASVRILGAPFAIDKSYCYHIPIQLESIIRVGSIVVVPFGGGNSTKNAVVEKIADSASYDKTKPILGVPGKYMYVKPELLELCHFMSDRLFCSVGDAVKCVLPAGLGVQKTTFYLPSVTEKNEEAAKEINAAARGMFDYIKRMGRVSAEDLKVNFGLAANQGAKVLTRLGLCNSEEGYTCRINTKNEKYAVLCHAEETAERITQGSLKLTPKQNNVYEVLLQYDMPLPAEELAIKSGVGKSVINELAKKGVLRLYEVDLDRSEDVLHSFDQELYGDFTLSEEQMGAFQSLYDLYRAGKPAAALLWGVTGSGKTNVLFKLIDEVLKNGRTVLVLVPEIALTAQTVGRFSARYQKDGIVLIHSALSVGERMDAWKKINDGDAKIIIGTRSAVFAPVDNIGLIVMDEEHEGSFKSDKSPRYHTRDIAKFRCVKNNALLVMASATPSIDSFYRARTGKYHLVTLKNRYGNAALPEVEFYDMKNEPFFELPEDAFVSDDKEHPAHDFSEPEDFFERAAGRGEVRPSVPAFLPKSAKGAFEELTAYDTSEQGLATPLVIGSRLKEALGECLDRKEQAILFVNRRGYQAFAVCSACGHTFTCPNCSVSLTRHKNRQTSSSRLTCHYCGYTQSVPQTCPKCGKKRIAFIGSGTQLVEETLTKKFPQARVLRMDADTTGGKFGHERILSKFRAGEADILVGTQMVAKGHDFPRVSLVGIAMADTSLFVNDYRANEKTFSLLTQALGRAGRAETSGFSIIQTYVPENEVLRLAASQDYSAFYEKEIAFRKASVFPPFCDIVTLDFSSPVESDVVNATGVFGSAIDTLASEKFGDVKFLLMGPFRNEVYRLAGKFRMRFLIKCRATPRFREMIRELLTTYIPALKNVTVTADINPTNL